MTYEKYSYVESEELEEPKPQVTPKKSSFSTDFDFSSINSSSQSPQKPPRDYRRLLLLALHITLIAGGIFLIYIIFVSPLVFEDSTNFSLTGELDNFSTSLNQSLTLNVRSYNLKLEERTELTGKRESFILSNFTGELFLENESLKLIGHSSRIQTSNSVINAQNQQITLKFEKGGVDIYLKELSMQISKNLDVSYSPDLVYSTDKKTNISIQNFNGTLSHDSLIGLYGKIDSFNISNNVSKLNFE